MHFDRILKLTVIPRTFPVFVSSHVFHFACVTYVCLLFPLRLDHQSPKMLNTMTDIMHQSGIMRQQQSPIVHRQTVGTLGRRQPASHLLENQSRHPVPIATSCTWRAGMYTHHHHRQRKTALTVVMIRTHPEILVCLTRWKGQGNGTLDSMPNTAKEAILPLLQSETKTTVRHSAYIYQIIEDIHAAGSKDNIPTFCHLETAFIDITSHVSVKMKENMFTHVQMHVNDHHTVSSSKYSISVEI